MRSLLLWTIALIAVLASTASAATASGVSVTVPWNDPQADDQPYLDGYLVWKDGQRRIVWGTPASSDDNVPARPPEAEETARAQQFMVEKWLNARSSSGFCEGCPEGDPHTKGTRLVTNPAPDEFVSDPLPMDLYPNITRGFQAVLYLQDHPQNDSPCDTAMVVNPTQIWNVEGGNRIRWFEPTLDLELRMGEKFVGAGYGGSNVIWSYVQPSKVRPADPQGYGACYYQMHPEVGFLPKDARLTLKVLHVDQQYHYPYGLAGDHRSFIRIWLYPTEELYYRFPELNPANAPEEEDEPGAGGAFALAALGAPGAYALRRRGSRTALLAALLVAVALAGCMGSKGGTNEGDDGVGPTGNVTNTFVPEIDPDAKAEHGSIRGLVFDDLHVPIQGVHVSLLGTSVFTETDGSGRFTFRDLVPGLYRLRFDKAEYRSFEAEVEVKAKFVSRPDITLYLLNAKSRDFRPHIHDYWEGRLEKSLGTQTIQPECPTEVTAPCTLPTRFTIQPKEDDPNTVLPGTAELELALSWDKAKLAADRLGLYINNLHGNQSTFAPREPGTPFRIRTSWEMTDIGHAPFSTWSLGWFVPGTEQRTFEEERMLNSPGHNPGAVTVTMKIHRGGALPLEPAHPDLWKGKTVLPLVEDWLAQWNYNTLAPPGDYPCLIYIDCYEAYYSYKELGNKFVPEGTLWIEAVATRTREPASPFSPRLYYKPANVPDHMSDLDTLAGFKVADASGGWSNGKLTFRIPLKEGEPDDPYAKRSGWVFTFRNTDEAAAWSENSQLKVITGEGWIDYHFTIKAHRDPMPT